MPRPFPTRRAVLLGGAAAVGAAAVDAFAIEPHWLRVTRHDVPVEGLPAALEGFSIAQVTDAHLTELGPVEEAIVDALRREPVQLVALTGDLVDSSDRLDALSELTGQLARSCPRVVATLGNWEHWGGLPLDDLARRYADAGARLLVDAWQESDGGVAVYATDDGLAGRPRPLADGPGAAVEVLLSHSPAFLDESPGLPRRHHLCLSGHTHGGQIRAGSFAPVVPPGSGRFVAGWYATPLGPAYVSSGTGTSILPARFCCRPELPVFTLTRA